ncbi:MAG: MATE family efflux transporter [Bacteroidales bacterium]|nr:MATE family efflux transporter [Bacteroidales bacterium]
MTSATPSYRKIWDIGWPIMISLFAQNIVGVTDTAFLGRVGEVELGGSAIGGLFYIILFMVGYGFTTGVQILIARRYGEKNFLEIGRIFDNSFYFLVISSLIVTLGVYFFGHGLLKLMVASDAIFNASSTYLKYRIFGLFFATAGLLFRSFYTGITFTRFLSISSIIMAVVNVILDYLLIFGKGGFPQMGIAGAAIASAIAEAVALVFLVIITIRYREIHRYKIFRWIRPDWSIIRSTLGVSFFVMIQYVLSLSIWFFFFLIIEKMGERPLAISNIARSVYMFLMIPGWAFCSVTNTLVSNALGEGKPEQVLPITYKIMRFSAIILFAVILIAAFFPNQILGIYTADQSLVDASFRTFYVILSALFLFSLMSILFNAVLGTANTKITLLIEIVTLVFYICYTWFVSNILHLAIEWVWTSEWIYASLLGIFSYTYLRLGNWRKKQI